MKLLAVFFIIPVMVLLTYVVMGPVIQALGAALRFILGV